MAADDSNRRGRTIDVVGERCGRYVNYRVVPQRLRELAEVFNALANDAEAAGC